MTQVIKKIKQKQANGTYSDYIPLGAEAQNVSTSDGDSVQLKLNKKPYYYNSVADMKADTKLKVGDMAVTLGYYEPNDGGNGEYRIVSGSHTDDGGSYHVLNNSLYAELIIKDNTVYAKQFGAKGDSSTDDADCLNAFFTFPCANYCVADGIFMISKNINIVNNNIYVYFKNAKVCYIPNDRNSYVVFSCDLKHDITFENIYLSGDRDEHMGVTGEYGHCLLLQECYNITVLNSTFEQAWGDGIIISNDYYRTPTVPIKNIIVKNCVISHISRNGITISSGDNIYIEDCQIDHVDRTDPKSGIDIETEHSDAASMSLGRVFITNVKVSNSYKAIGTNIKTADSVILIKNCIAEHNEYGYVISHFVQNASLTMIDCVDINSKLYGFGVSDIASTAQVNFINPTVIGGQQKAVFGTSYNAGFIFFATSADCYNVKVTNLTVQNNSDNYGKYSAIVCSPNSSDYKIYNVEIDTVKAGDKTYYFPSTLDLATCTFKNLESKEIKTGRDSIIGASNRWYNKIISPNIEMNNFTLTFLKHLPNGRYDWEIWRNTNPATRQAHVDLTAFDNVYFNTAKQSNKLFYLDTSATEARFRMDVYNSDVYIHDCIGEWTPQSGGSI